MAQPTQGQTHVDAVLTNISVAYMQMADNFIASRVFPIVPVEKQSNVYFTYDKNDFMRDEMQRRPDGTESAGSGYGLSTASYNCEVWGLHKDIGDQVRANTDNPLNPDRDATQYLTQKGLLRQESQFVTDYFTTSVWGTDSTPSALWSTYATSTPIRDVKVGKKTVLSNTGYLPNTLVLSYEVFDVLTDHPDFVDRIKYSSSDAVTRDLMARLFEVDNVYVAQSVAATNVEGETEAYGFAAGKHALVCYVNPTPSLLAPSAGYTFNWNGVSAGLGENVGISRFRMDHLKADRVEIEMAFDNKVVGSDLGYFFNGAVA